MTFNHYYTSSNLVALIKNLDNYSKFNIAVGAGWCMNHGNPGYLINIYYIC